LDKRCGTNGARIPLAPPKDRAVNHPKLLNDVLKSLKKIQEVFNGMFGYQAITLYAQHANPAPFQTFSPSHEYHQELPQEGFNQSNLLNKKYLK